MTLQQRIGQAALALREARLTRMPVAPVSTTYGLTGLDVAYEIAALNVSDRVAAGARVVGRKIGLTSRAVQQQLGVDQPDFGMLFDDMEYLDQAEVPMDRLIQPKVEAEVAFVIGRDLLSPAPTYSEFLHAVEYALPALEIVDSAIADWKISLVDTVADNASCGLYVLGHQPVDIGGLSLADLGMSMSIDGAVASVGAGAACLGHPLRAGYWLARTMATRGQGLKEGEVILSGALGPMATVQPGQRVQAHIAALGSVACRLV